MGCCESRSNNEITMDLQYKAYYNNGMSQNFYPNREHLKNNGIRPEMDSLKNSMQQSSEIPMTKEVKVPSVEIPIEIIKSKSRLVLTIFESKYISEGTVLNITPGGLEGSERMARDGVVIFGTKNNEFINDFNFPDEDVIGKRHFEIKYDILKDLYRIKNLFGSGLFVKIEKKLLLRNNSIFSFSTSHIIVKISMDPRIDNGEVNENEIINSTISLKVIHGINENKEFIFDSKNNSKITLGRIQVNGIDIAFGEESTSRVQCIIFYENNNWYIVDADGTKQSLNGTWYLADEYMDIYDGMVFRAGTTSFQAQLIDP